MSYMSISSLLSLSHLSKHDRSEGVEEVWSVCFGHHAMKYRHHHRDINQYLEGRRREEGGGEEEEIIEEESHLY